MGGEGVSSRWPSTLHGRAVLVTVLVLAQLGLLVWFGSLNPNPALGRYPGQESLATDYDVYVGERVSVDGRVVSTDPVTIRAEHPDGSLQLVITDVGHAVTEGDFLQVYGIVEPGGIVRAINTFAVPPTGRWYTWGVSFIAGLWVLGRVIHDWRFDRSTGGLAPRRMDEGDVDA